MWDSLKLNVDAHSLSDGCWGLGFILLRSDGSPVVVRTKTVVTYEEATLAEAIGIREVLQWIKDNNLANIIVESDEEKKTWWKLFMGLDLRIVDTGD